MVEHDWRRTWSQIAEHFHELAMQDVASDKSAFTAAMRAMEMLALRIDARAPTPLYGWTSMHALCIHQTQAIPYSQPFLRLEPPRVGAQFIEILLLNPQDDDDKRQALGWSVPPEELNPWLDTVLRRIGWIRTPNYPTP